MLVIPTQPLYCWPAITLTIVSTTTLQHVPTLPHVPAPERTRRQNLQPSCMDAWMGSLKDSLFWKDGLADPNISQSPFSKACHWFHYQLCYDVERTDGYQQISHERRFEIQTQSSTLGRQHPLGKACKPEITWTWRLRGYDVLKQCAGSWRKRKASRVANSSSATCVRHPRVMTDQARDRPWYGWVKCRDGQGWSKWRSDV